MSKPSLQALLDTVNQCHRILSAASIPHLLIGGLAVRFYGFKRDTRDVDLLVRHADWSTIQTVLTVEGFRRKNRSEFLTPDLAVKVSFRFGSDDPGGLDASLPDPANDEFRASFESVPGIPVFGGLIELIKHKLECGIRGQLKGGKHASRSIKHFKDAFGLIFANATSS